LLYGLYRSLGADVSEPSVSAAPSVEVPTALPTPALEVVRALDAPSAAAPTAATPQEPAPGASSPTAGATSEPAAPAEDSTKPSPTPDATNVRSPRQAASRAGSAATRSREPAAPAEAPARTEPKPFIFHFDGDNPYDGAKASPPAPRRARDRPTSDGTVKTGR
jgi:hypothetical protein